MVAADCGGQEVQAVNQGFAKLDSGILDSTVWVEPHDVLRVWIALLAKCDAYGIVRCSVPALALVCMVTVDRLNEILDVLRSPDPYSRTETDEGRRIKDTDGGWVITNYIKYRELTQGKRGSHAERQQRYRERLARRDEITSQGVTGDAYRRHKASLNVTSDTEAEAEAEESKESTLRVLVETRDASPDPSPAVNGDSGQRPPTDADNGATDAAPDAKRCPIAEIVALYHAALPELPRVVKLTTARTAAIRQRWREDLESLDDWRAYFADVKTSPFLTGRVAPRDGRKPFVASLPWLVKAENFAKVAEGKYHEGSP